MVRNNIEVDVKVKCIEQGMTQAEMWANSEYFMIVKVF